jgi:hypothetical protein
VQIALVRVMTDGATLADLDSVDVIELCHIVGWSRRILESIMAHLDLPGVRRFLLVSRHTDGWQERLGCQALARFDIDLKIDRRGRNRE